MPTLRVMSWNLRTLGSHTPREIDYAKIIDAIKILQPDIICIQELQSGRDVPLKIGVPISQSSIDIILAISLRLNGIDSTGKWTPAISGINSGSRTSMRDAYAFIICQAPSASKIVHSDAVDFINIVTNPIILQQQKESDGFPGRRPGMLTCNVGVGKNITPVNIVSYHALTPCNSFDGAGKGINYLATLDEIGGGMMYFDQSSRQYAYKSGVKPLPYIDTIVLGDFNYSTDVKGAIQVYQNLLTNYTACINTPKDVKSTLYTTYSADPTKPFGLTSAYDNIFVLNSHDKFVASLKFSGNRGVFDFIKQEAEQLGAAAELKYFATESAWYVVYTDYYKGQHAVNGLSDHLPVWADFTVGDSKGGGFALRILPTSGSDNNCMFHAIFGVLDPSGYYIAANAATLRTNFVASLTGCIANNAFPNQSVKQGILGAMINYYSGNALALNLLQWFLTNPLLNPLDNSIYPIGPAVLADFTLLYTNYVNSINTGRMMYAEELEAVAYYNNIKVTLYNLDRGQYFSNNYNAGGANGPVTIFHQGVHFSRFNAA